MKDWLILFCIGIIAVLAFRERDRWMPQNALSATSSQSVAALPPLQGEVVSLNPPSDAPDSPEKADLANQVAQSQRLATAKYPALGVATSEINIRFNFRYKHLLADHSSRLQDPAWPLQLADECAKDSGVRPAANSSPAPSPASAPKAASMPPAPAAQPTGAPKTVSVPPATAQAVSTSAPSLRIPQPSPAAGQTLVFHPANAGVAQAPFAVAVAAASPPKASGSLPFVTLDAVNQKSANNYTYNWGYWDYGWYDISFRQSVGISINVRNMSRDPAAVNLRWLFFARQNNNSRFVFGGSGKELDLAPGQSDSVSADSPMLQRREVNDSWLGQRYLSGSKYEGWLVQLLDRNSNRIIKQTGSTSYLEDLAKRTDFSTLLDEYRSKLHTQGGGGSASTVLR